MGIIIEIIGVVVIFASTDIGRAPCCEIKTFSRDGLLMIALITIGITIIKNSDLICNLIK